MSDLRESHIQIKTAEFNDDHAKFSLILHYDFNKETCHQRMENIKSLGIEPSNNVIVITHEFESEQGAQQMVTTLNNFNEAVGGEAGSPLSMISSFCESITAKEKKVVACLRLPPMATEPLVMLDSISDMLGDIVSKDQYLEFKIASACNLKEIFSGQLGSPAAGFLEGVCIRLQLMMHKDSPQKLFEFASNFVTEYEKPEVIKAGTFFSAFKHLKVDLTLKKPTEELKELYKNEMLMGVMCGAQFLCGMAEQFGFMEAVANGGPRTTAVLCLSPFISVEFSLDAPTALEALNEAANPS